MSATQTIDEQVHPRSLLLMNTETPIDNQAATEFIGGARVVLAKSDQALLPFQLGLGIDRMESGPIAAEIGALTAYTKDNPGKSVDVVNAAIKLAIDDLNYILRFDAKNWQNGDLQTKSALTGTH